MQINNVKKTEVITLNPYTNEVLKNTISISVLPEIESNKIKEGLRYVEEELLKVRDKILSDINNFDSDPDVTSQLFVKYDELFAFKNEIHSVLVQK